MSSHLSHKRLCSRIKKQLLRMIPALNSMEFNKKNMPYEHIRDLLIIGDAYNRIMIILKNDEID